MAKEVLEMEVKSNIGAVTKDTKKLAQSTVSAKKGFKGMGTAIKGVGMAMKAAGIGLIIALFVALKEAVQRNQKAMDLMETVLTTVSTTFNQLVTVLTDVVTWVTESTDRFDALGKVLKSVITLALTPLQLSFYGLKLGVQEAMLAWEDSFLGGGDKGVIASLKADILETKTSLFDLSIAAVDAGKDLVENFSEAIDEVGGIYDKVAAGITDISLKANYEQAQATIAAVKAAKFAAAEFAKLNAQKLKEAEDQRKIRDNVNLTFAERIKANEKLNDILEEQQKLQSEQIQKQITAAALAVEQNGNDENKLALLEAQNAQLELKEAIGAQMSEQITNQTALENELLATQTELRAEGLSGLERELQELQDAYDLKIEMARKAGVDTTAITAQYTKEQTDLKKAASEEEEALDKAVRDAKVGLAQSGLALISAIAVEGSNIGKAAAVTSATISGIEGVQNAFTTAQKSPLTAVMPAYPFIQAGLAGAFSAIQIQKILSGSPSTTTPPPPTTDTNTPSPQMMSGAFDISGGVAPEATKAYVVTDEMSNSQNQLANIRRRATI